MKPAWPRRLAAAGAALPALAMAIAAVVVGAAACLPSAQAQGQAAGLAQGQVLDEAQVTAQTAAQVQAPAYVLPRVQDLRRDGEQVRRERKPLLLFFSTPGCPYCLEVRRNYLAPRVAQADAEVLIREVDITSARTFVGVDGAQQREVDLATALGVRLVPAVRLVDDRLAPLAPPLVGWNDAGFYEGYLAGAIDEARRKLGAR